MSEKEFKIPCGDKPERYPRTNAAKFRKSKLWDKMGPTSKYPEPKLKTTKESEQ